MTKRQPKRPAALGYLEAGRDAYARQAWADAFENLSAADAIESLAAADLERLAWAAGLVARDQDFVDYQERLFNLHEHAGDELAAARSAVWLGMRLFMLGETARAGGWIGRAIRLAGERDCAEQGYVLLPNIFKALATGEFDTALTTAERAVTIGEKHGDHDLIALGRNLSGRACVRLGEVERGLALLDEAMLLAAPDRVSPIVTGIVYCNVIQACRQVFALDRSREWTALLTQWCKGQLQLVSFAGECHAHRAEIMQLSGDWDNAVAESRLATGRPEETEAHAVGPAFYQEAEVHRMRGDFAAAERAYNEAHQHGHDPHPGLALMRLAAGRADAAAGGIRRAVASSPNPLARARLLPALVEIVLAVGDTAEAEQACAELSEISNTFKSEILDSIASHARGSVLIARGDHAAAIPLLDQAFAAWNSFGAPYLAARVRVDIGVCYQALDDAEGAAFEFEAARTTLAELGARPELTRLAGLSEAGTDKRPSGLTRREMEVLRLIAAGMTNHAIADALNISERTVDRHVSNILNKIDAPSRAAATAFAYEQGLI